MTPILRICGPLIVIALLVVLTTSSSAHSETSVFRWTAHYTSPGKLVERVFNSTGHLQSCLVYGERKLSEDVLQLIPRENQFLVNEENFQALVLSCHSTDAVDLSEVQHSRKKRQTIYPGTKWCGAGNIATDYNDLGTNEAVDRCCRTHDFCEIVIHAGETKYGLTNTQSFTILDCACDQEFRDCLRAVGTASANTIGYLYFLASTKCIEMARPIICTG